MCLIAQEKSYVEPEAPESCFVVREIHINGEIHSPYHSWKKWTVGVMEFNLGSEEFYSPFQRGLHIKSKMFHAFTNLADARVCKQQLEDTFEDCEFTIYQSNGCGLKIVGLLDGLRTLNGKTGVCYQELMLVEEVR